VFELSESIFNNAEAGKTASLEIPNQCEVDPEI
jgi:hypothetical protein